jgi:hypothetical protein
MKLIFISQASKQLARNNLTALAGEEIKPKAECKHQDYCYLFKMNGECRSHNLDCETFKFYNKYGEKGNYLGI